MHNLALNKGISMQRFLTLVLGLICAFSVTSFAQKRRGPGEAGGGGTTVSLNGKPELLDVYLFKKTRSHYPTPSPAPGTKGATLPSTSALSYVHIDKLNDTKVTNSLKNSQFLPVQIALQKIDALWGTSPPAFIQTLKRALVDSPVYYMGYRFTRKDGDHWIPKDLTNEIPDSALQVIAYYVKDMGMIVSKKDFEALDLFNQVAFVLHESLRQMQYTYEMEFSSEDLQTVVANIVFGIPILPEKVQNLMTKDDSMQAQAIVNFNKARNDGCALVSKLPQKDFAEAKEIICNAPYFDEAMRFDDPRARSEILMNGLETAAVKARELYNQGKLNNGHSSTFMKLSVAAITASSNWSLYSKELAEALNVMKGATVGLNNYSFDSAIKVINNPSLYSPSEREKFQRYADHLKSTMENWKKQGALKD